MKYTTKELMSFISLYNKETERHSRRVAELTKKMTEGMEERQRKEIYTAALLHDIGKLYIPRTILNKPYPLTRLERKIIDTHAFFGYKTLSESGYNRRICGMVLLHHGENHFTDVYSEEDDLLEDSEVRRGAEIISCCDIYDATTSDRPYRKALRENTAMEILNESMFIPREIKQKFRELNQIGSQKVVQFAIP